MLSVSLFLHLIDLHVVTCLHVVPCSCTEMHFMKWFMSFIGAQNLISNTAAGACNGFTTTTCVRL